MVSEGQAEPWEAVTIAAQSARPAHVQLPAGAGHRATTTTAWAGRSRRRRLDAYLFWGAEYWLLRQRTGDASYLRAFERVLETA